MWQKRERSSHDCLVKIPFISQILTFWLIIYLYRGFGLTVSIWDLESKELDPIVELKTDGPGVSGDEIWSLEFSENGKFLATLSRWGHLLIWETQVNEIRCRQQCETATFMLWYRIGICLVQLNCPQTCTWTPYPGIQAATPWLFHAVHQA